MIEDSETRRLEALLLDWIEAAPPGFVCAVGDRATRYGLAKDAATALERRFESLALQLFEYQYARIPVYRALADALRRHPDRIESSLEIPALPVEAFKSTRVATFGTTQEVATFRTSGTTSEGRPGVLHLDSLALYDLSLERTFQHHVLPDTDQIRMLLLGPSVPEAPHSSLAYMLDRVRSRFGSPGSTTVLKNGKLHWDRLKRELESASASGEPVCLLGTALGWAQVLELCREHELHVQLPPGSRVFETGGFKGRRRVVRRDELVGDLERVLGIEPHHVVSEYGMTEMGSQLYTCGLRRSLLGEEPGDEGLSYPAWLRPRLIDSESGRLCELEERVGVGLIAHQDLANRCSVAQLLTGDLGRARNAGLMLLGRCPRAELRGCGLADETLASDVA